MQAEVLSGLLHDVYMMQSLWRSVATATVTAAVMRQRFHRVPHEITCLIHVIVRVSVSPIIQIEATHIDQ